MRVWRDQRENQKSLTEDRRRDKKNEKKGAKLQTMVDKTQHRKLYLESHYKSGFPGG